MGIRGVAKPPAGLRLDLPARVGGRAPAEAGKGQQCSASPLWTQMSHAEDTALRNETKVERPGFSLNWLCDLRQMATPLRGCVLRASEMQGCDLSRASVGIVFELGTPLLKQGPGSGGQFGRSREEAKITPHCALRSGSIPSCPTSTRVGIRGIPSLPCPTKAARSDFILVSYVVSTPSALICKRGSERPHFSET